MSTCTTWRAAAAAVIAEPLLGTGVPLFEKKGIAVTALPFPIRFAAT